MPLFGDTLDIQQFIISHKQVLLGAGFLSPRSIGSPNISTFHLCALPFSSYCFRIHHFILVLKVSEAEANVQPKAKSLIQGGGLAQPDRQ